MKIGDKVEIIYKLDHRRIPRRSVGRLIEETPKEWVLSLRPDFGTSVYNKSEVQSIKVVPPMTKIVADERADDK